MSRTHHHAPTTGRLLLLAAGLALALAPTPARASSRTWLFNNSTGGWTGSSGTSVTSDGGSNLHVVFATGGGLYSNDFVASPYYGYHDDYIRFAYRFTNGAIATFKFNFQTTTRPDWTSPDYMMTGLVHDGQWHYATFNVGSITGWPDHFISRLRFIALGSGGGGASGTMDMDFMVMRLDDKSPNAVSVGPASPSGWTNGDISIPFSGNDPPPNGFDGSANPDKYGSGIDHFNWWIDSGGSGSFPNTGYAALDAEYLNSGWDTRTLTLSRGMVPAGAHPVYVNAADRCEHGLGPVGGVYVYYDPNPPGTPVVGASPGGWTNANSFYFWWANPGDDYSGVSYYDVLRDGAYLGATGATELGLAMPSAGVHSVQVRAVDVAGNAGGWSAPAYVYFDDGLPTSDPVAVSPTGYSVQDDFTFSWGAGSDALSGVAGYYYSVDGGPLVWTTARAVRGAFAGGVVGPHTFYEIAVDNAGNWGSAWQSVSFYYYPEYVAPVSGLVPGSGQVALPQTFSWAPSGSGYKDYIVQVASDAGFTVDLSTFRTDVPWLMVPAAAAPNNGQTYYWRVATAVSVPPNWSTPPAQFTPYVPPPPPAAQVIGQDFPAGEAGDGVNTSLGAVTRNLALLTLRGPGGDVPLTAWYSSQAQRNSLLGSRWNWTLGQLLTPGAVVTLEDNQDLAFTPEGGGFKPGLGIYDSLASVGDGYVLVRPSRERLSFDAIGTLQQIADRSGNAVTLHYSGGVLTTFNDAAGRSYSVTVTNSRVTQIHDVLGRTWNFEYSGGYLSAFTDAKGAKTQFEYDGQGRLTRVVDPLEHEALRCSYDGQGRVSTQTDAVGNVTTFSYDDVNRRTTVTNPLLGTEVHVHDADSRLIADIDERGDSTSYSYDANHNRITVRDGRGYTTSYQYDPRGNVCRVVDALGGSTRTLYDATNSPVQRVDALGNTATFANDALGRPVEIDEPLSRVTRFEYNAAGQILRLTDANLHVRSNVYDAQGNRTSSTNGAGDVTSYGYDAAGRRTSVTDGLSHTTSFSYDADDSLLTQTNGLSQTTAYEYDLNRNRTATVDPRGQRTEYSYDAKDRLVQILDPLGDLTRQSYDELDRRSQRTDARGGVTTYGYDAVGNLTREQDAAGNATTHTYDANRNRLSTTDARGKSTHYTYDALNRRLTTADPLGHTTSNAYDVLGHLVSVTDARGATTGYGYDALGRLTSVQAPGSGQLQYGYDLVGNHTSVTNAKNHTTQLSYDGADRLVSTRDPLGNTQGYAYDVAGHRVRRTDGRGQATSYTYDAADRLVQTAYSDSSRVLRSYDPAGNLATFTDRWGSATCGYDGLNRLTTIIDHYGKVLTFAYDSTGNLSELDYPGGDACLYSYDPVNRLSGVTDWKDRAIGYAYDANGNPTGITHPNGVTTALAYDDASRLLSILVQTPARDTLVSFAYTLDENGNRTRTVRVDRRAEPERSGGADIYATSAALSSGAFPAGADSVVLASGDTWAEAVTAPFVARRMGVPALVVPGDNLWASAATQTELTRLHGLHPTLGAVVLGDIGGVSEVVEAQLQQQGLSVRRIRGADRSGTAALAAAASPTAVLLGAGDRTRAGAAALLAARLKAPLLFSERDSLPVATQVALSAAGAARTILVGDEGTIGPAVADWLNAHGHPVWKRHSSADPVALSVQALEDSVPAPDRCARLQVANRNVYQDALSAAAAADPWNMPTLLAGQDSVASSPDLVRWIGRHRGWLQHATLLGSTSALSASAEAELRNLLRTTVTEYTYSQLDELLSEIVPGVDSTAYSYDAMGNRASITHNGVPTVYGYDGADRLISAGATQYTYDANGNRLTRTAGSTTTTYAYDFENRLTQINGPEGTSKYRYDGIGRRIRAEEPGRIVRYVVDPTTSPYRTLREMDDRNVTLHSYVFGPGLASDLTKSGSVRFYHFDGLGSTAALTDSAGNDVGHLGYTAFGDTAIDLGATDTRLGYVGRYGVEGTASGLSFMRDRFYDPETGLFLGQDPEAGEDRDFVAVALYLYAAGNPVNAVDPDGHAKKKPNPKPTPKPKPPALTREWPFELVFQGNLDKLLPKSAVLGGVQTVGKAMITSGLSILTGVPGIGTAATLWSGKEGLFNFYDKEKLDNAQRYLMVYKDWDADAAGNEIARQLKDRNAIGVVNGRVMYNPKEFNDVYTSIVPKWAR